MLTLLLVGLLLSSSAAQEEADAAGATSDGSASSDKPKSKSSGPLLLVDSSAPLTIDDMAIVISSSAARLPLVEASRPSRKGIRTVIAIESEEQATALTAKHGKKHMETYVACAVSLPTFPMLPGSFAVP